MSDVQVVFRATAQATQQYRADIRAGSAERTARLESLRAEYGIDADAVLANRGRVLGFAYIGTPPKGWRRDRDVPDAIVPDRRTRAGRDTASVLEGLPTADSRAYFPGRMPPYTLASHTLIEPGARVLDGRLHVTWPGTIPESSARRIDPEVWEQILLSTYYLAIEAGEASSDAA